MTATAPARQEKHPNLLRGPASPEQTRGLTPGNNKHRAYSAKAIGPERERILPELRAAFPSVRGDRLVLLAGSRARIELLTRYIDDVGLIRNRHTGEVYPAVSLLLREESVYRAELEKVEALEAAAGEPRGGRLAAIEAEIAGEDSQPAQGAAANE